MEPPWALWERPLNAVASLLMLALTALLLSCSGSATRPQGASDGVEWQPLPPADEFSVARAWSDLRALAGAEGSGGVRDQLRASLSAMGLAVEERATPLTLESGEVEELVHLEVVLPGASSDRFVLLAPYGSPRAGSFGAHSAREDYSGAALLLELTRAFSQRRSPYSIQVLFLEGEGRLRDAKGPRAAGTGSRLLAASMAERGEFEGIRLLVAFDRVCGKDLRVARDLRSQRHHRERFWTVAGDLGYARIFPSERAFESVVAGHRPFAELGLRPVLAIVDSSYVTRDESRDASEAPRDLLARCMPECLEAVGAVSLASLLSIGEQLERIDRFAAQPRATDDSLATAASPPAPAEPELSR